MQARALFLRHVRCGLGAFRDQGTVHRAQTCDAGRAGARPYRQASPTGCEAVLRATARGRVHPENGFTGFHEIQLISRQELRVSRIVLQQSQLFA
jgi:hypothetical protein